MIDCCRREALIAGVAAAVLTTAAGIGCHTAKAEPGAPTKQTPTLQALAPVASGQEAPQPPTPKAEEAVPNEPEAAEPTTEAQPLDEQPAAPQDKPGPFDPHAFPPTLSDSEWHADAWDERDCLRCHETGVGDATIVRHQGMPRILLSAKCRTCHVFIPGSKPRPAPEPDPRFMPEAFPPMIPASSSHPATWWKNDCLLCHEDGLRGAPPVRHQGMPKILLTAKCRTCHVQVRAIEAERNPRTGR